VQDKCIDDLSVPVHLGPAIVLSPPLHGDGWLALNGLSNTSGHRRTLVVVNGKVHLAQRFATELEQGGQRWAGVPGRSREYGKLVSV